MFFIKKNVLNEGEKKVEKNIHFITKKNVIVGHSFCPAAQGEMHNLFISSNTGRKSI